MVTEIVSWFATTMALKPLYAHLSKLDVRPGTLVNAGQLLGLGGSTGHSTGPHLHFEIRFLGRPLNPTAVIDFPNETVKTDTLNVELKIFQMPAGSYHYKKRRGSTAAADPNPEKEDILTTLE